MYLLHIFQRYIFKNQNDKSRRRCVAAAVAAATFWNTTDAGADSDVDCDASCDASAAYVMPAAAGRQFHRLVPRRVSVRPATGRKKRETKRYFKISKYSRII